MSDYIELKRLAEAETPGVCPCGIPCEPQRSGRIGKVRIPWAQKNIDAATRHG